MARWTQQRQYPGLYIHTACYHQSPFAWSSLQCLTIKWSSLGNQLSVLKSRSFAPTSWQRGSSECSGSFELNQIPGRELRCPSTHTCCWYARIRSMLQHTAAKGLPWIGSRNQSLPGGTLGDFLHLQLAVRPLLSMTFRVPAFLKQPLLPLHQQRRQVVCCILPEPVDQCGLQVTTYMFDAACRFGTICITITITRFIFTTLLPWNLTVVAEHRSCVLSDGC